MNDWTENAACRPGDPNDWLLPEDRHSGRPMSANVKAKIARCKTICAGCPVRRVCLAEALRTPGESAIRGGLTFAERLPLGQAAMPKGKSRMALR